MVQELRGSAVQMVYLAALLGAESLVGTPDPFTGLLAHEVEAALVTGRQQLLREGVITEGVDGTIGVAPFWAELALTYAHPAVSLILTVTRQGVTERRCFHVTGRGAAEQRVEPDGSIRLIRLGGLIEVQERLAVLAGLPAGDLAAAAGGDGVVLPEERWMATWELALADGAAAAAQHLVAAGLGRPLADDLAAALAGSAPMVTLLAVRPDGQEGMGYLEGSAQRWLLTRDERQGDPWVEVRPATARQVSTRMARLMAVAEAAAVTR